jgi:aminopeptidase N
MVDARPLPAQPPPVIKREEYRPPDWLVPEIALEFELGGERTIVRATPKVDGSPALRGGGDQVRQAGALSQRQAP